MRALPKVILIGASDIDARLELMNYLKDDFNISALGTKKLLYHKFKVNNFEFSTYPFTRRINPIFDIISFLYLIQYFRKQKPKIVHSFDTKPGILARIAAKIAGVPVIIGTIPGLGSLYVSEDYITKIVRYIYEIAQKEACNLANLTIFQNSEDFSIFKNSGIVPEKKAAVVLGSGVSTQFYNPKIVSLLEQKEQKNLLGIKPNEIIVTMVSRIIRTKGVFEFLAAYKKIKTYNLNCRFLLVGPLDKNSVDRLTSAEIIELKKSRVWVGHSDNVRILLSFSDIFVLPSSYREGIPRVLLEAASMGLPIVTNNNAGCNEVVQHGVNGFLVKKNEPENLSKYILELINNQKLRKKFGNFSRKIAIKQFDNSIIGEKIKNIYKQQLEAKNFN